MSMIDFAKEELDRIGLTADDPTGEDMNYMMREHILRMVHEFTKEGHSGFSANYAISALTRILSFKPLTPLTGEDDEWVEIEEGRYQNRRYGSVFKDETGAYDIDGIVFYDWYTDEETGKPFKSYFTSRDSRVYIEFPYTVPDKPEYRERLPEDD